MSVSTHNAEINTGSPVIYNHPLGDWSAVVTKIDHAKRWAYLTFDGILVPENYKIGIPSPNDSIFASADAIVPCDRLSTRAPAEDDDLKRANWRSKVVAYATKIKTQDAAIRTAEKESYSHFQLGQHVTWSQMTGSGHTDTYTNYAGTIEKIDLSALVAVVKGSPLDNLNNQLTVTARLGSLHPVH